MNSDWSFLVAIFLPFFNIVVSLACTYKFSIQPSFPFAILLNDPIEIIRKKSNI